MGMIKEFKAFALKGNMVDIAVGMIIGAAFSKAVTSLVNDVIMPPIGMLLGQMDFSKLAITLQGKDGPVTLRYGAFINTLVDFFIVAWVIFIVIKLMNRLRPAEPTEVTEKPCPKCCTQIPLLATRCPHCTSDLG